MPSSLRPVIGVDFDNTIVSYDDVMHSVAVDRGLIDLSVVKNKKSIRDTIRQLPNGEFEWQIVQAIAYGARISEASMTEGIANFFRRCRHNDIPVYIISHKTTFSSVEEYKTNLRTAAIDWMECKGFFVKEGLGLCRDQIYFEATRRDKIQRIAALQCTHFIDDLEETFLEDSFPAEVMKILFAPGASAWLPGMRTFHKWDQISEFVFGQH